jgi:hypothetical protein
LLETNTNTFIEIVIRLHLENFNTWLKKAILLKTNGFLRKTAMLAHSRGNLISISWAKNLSPAFSRFLLKSESYAGIGHYKGFFGFIARYGRRYSWGNGDCNQKQFN